MEEKSDGIKVKVEPDSQSETSVQESEGVSSDFIQSDSSVPFSEVKADHIQSGSSSMDSEELKVQNDQSEKVKCEKDENANIRTLLGKRPAALLGLPQAFLDLDNESGKKLCCDTDNINLGPSVIGDVWSLKNPAPCLVPSSENSRVTNVEKEWQETFKISNKLPDAKVLFGDIGKSSALPGELTNKLEKKPAPITLSNVSWKPPVLTGDNSLDEKLMASPQNFQFKQPLDVKPISRKFSFLKSGANTCGGSVLCLKEGQSGPGEFEEIPLGLHHPLANFHQPSNAAVTHPMPPPNEMPKIKNEMQRKLEKPEKSYINHAIKQTVTQYQPVSADTQSRNSTQHQPVSVNSQSRNSIPQPKKANPAPRHTPVRQRNSNPQPRKPRQPKPSKQAPVFMPPPPKVPGKMLPPHQFELRLGSHCAGGNMFCERQAEVPKNQPLVPSDFVKGLMKSMNTRPVDPAVDLVTNTDMKRFLNVPDPRSPPYEFSNAAQMPPQMPHAAIKALLNTGPAQKYPGFIPDRAAQRPWPTMQSLPSHVTSPFGSISPQREPQSPRTAPSPTLAEKIAKFKAEISEKIGVNTPGGSPNPTSSETSDMDMPKSDSQEKFSDVWKKSEKLYVSPSGKRKDLSAAVGRCPSQEFNAVPTSSGSTTSSHGTPLRIETESLLPPNFPLTLESPSGLSSRSRTSSTSQSTARFSRTPPESIASPEIKRPMTFESLLAPGMPLHLNVSQGRTLPSSGSVTFSSQNIPPVSKIPTPRLETTGYAAPPFFGLVKRADSDIPSFTPRPMPPMMPPHLAWHLSPQDNSTVPDRLPLPNLYSPSFLPMLTNFPRPILPSPTNQAEFQLSPKRLFPAAPVLLQQPRPITPEVSPARSKDDGYDTGSSPQESPLHRHNVPYLELTSSPSRFSQLPLSSTPPKKRARHLMCLAELQNPKLGDINARQEFLQTGTTSRAPTLQNVIEASSSNSISRYGSQTSGMNPDNFSNNLDHPSVICAADSTEEGNEPLNLVMKSKPVETPTPKYHGFEINRAMDLRVTSHESAMDLRKQLTYGQIPQNEYGLGEAQQTVLDNSEEGGSCTQEGGGYEPREELDVAKDSGVDRMNEFLQVMHSIRYKDTMGDVNGTASEAKGSENSNNEGTHLQGNDNDTTGNTSRQNDGMGNSNVALELPNQNNGVTASNGVTLNDLRQTEFKKGEESAGRESEAHNETALVNRGSTEMSVELTSNVGDTYKVPEAEASDENTLACDECKDPGIGYCLSQRKVPITVLDYSIESLDNLSTVVPHQRDRVNSEVASRSRSASHSSLCSDTSCSCSYASSSITQSSKCLKDRNSVDAEGEIVLADENQVVCTGYENVSGTPGSDKDPEGRFLDGKIIGGKDCQARNSGQRDIDLQKGSNLSNLVRYSEKDLDSQGEINLSNAVRHSEKTVKLEQPGEQFGEPAYKVSLLGITVLDENTNNGNFIANPNFNQGIDMRLETLVQAERSVKSITLKQSENQMDSGHNFTNLKPKEECSMPKASFSLPEWGRSTVNKQSQDDLEIKNEDDLEDSPKPIQNTTAQDMTKSTFFHSMDLRGRRRGSSFPQDSGSYEVDPNRKRKENLKDGSGMVNSGTNLGKRKRKSPGLLYLLKSAEGEKGKHVESGENFGKKTGLEQFSPSVRSFSRGNSMEEGSSCSSAGHLVIDESSVPSFPRSPHHVEAVDNLKLLAAVSTELVETDRHLRRQSREDEILPCQKRKVIQNWQCTESEEVLDYEDTAEEFLNERVQESRGKRHCMAAHGERQLLPQWIEEQIERGDIPGFEWVDKKEKIVQIPWRHHRSTSWNLQDCILFRRWAIHTGKHVPGEPPNPKKWKTNFRCALNLYAQRLDQGKEFCLYKLYPTALYNTTANDKSKKKQVTVEKDASLLAAERKIDRDYRKKKIPSVVSTLITEENFIRDKIQCERKKSSEGTSSCNGSKRSRVNPVSYLREDPITKNTMVLYAKSQGQASVCDEQDISPSDDGDASEASVEKRLRSENHKKSGSIVNQLEEKSGNRQRTNVKSKAKSKKGSKPSSPSINLDRIFSQVLQESGNYSESSKTGQAKLKDVKEVGNSYNIHISGMDPLLNNTHKSVNNLMIGPQNTGSKKEKQLGPNTSSLVPLLPILDFTLHKNISVNNNGNADPNSNESVELPLISAMSDSGESVEIKHTDPNSDESVELSSNSATSDSSESVEMQPESHHSSRVMLCDSVNPVELQVTFHKSGNSMQSHAQRKSGNFRELRATASKSDNAVELPLNLSCDEVSNKKH